MEIVEHLSELRKRLIITLLMFLVSFVTAFLFVEQIYQFLVKDLAGKLALLGLTDIIWIYILISGVLAISITIPTAAFQAWQFVKPALSS